MDEFWATLFQFYGLDWITMLLGLTGTYLISNQDKRGFVFSALACICSLAVAVISGQIGFVVYNLVVIALMLKGFMSWNRKAAAA
jgi:hypothetical protein